MLEKLTINNIALIHSQSIEFTDGLNVLTGETGAGKSLIIDSLSLLLGEKADKSLISRGEKFASVEAVFTDIPDAVKSVMVELGLEEDDTLIITRKISMEGKNECRVNGNTFTLSMLKRLSSYLMDLHGQFEHQNLLKISSHIGILDLYGGKKVLDLKNKYVDVLNEYKTVLEELDGFTVDDQERERLIELYGYQMQEIDDAGFYEGEEEELKNYRNQVLHQEKILEAINGAIKIASGDNYEYAGVLDSVKKIGVLLNSIMPYLNQINEVVDRVESVKIELEDISNELESILDNVYFDEQKAKENEDRLDLLSSFKKKYGFDITAINDYREKIGREYEKLVNSYERIAVLKAQKVKIQEALVNKANELTKERQKVAKEFEKAIKQELVELGMKSANFVVDFKPLSLDSLSVFGLDKVEFMFSANLGELVKPLKDVASGGEMSRFMLAVKNITARIEGIGTLVFDEVDTGVSGHIALVLAEKLDKVSQMAQVICVTHLAQISSYGKTHFFIEKHEENGKTITEVMNLNGEARAKEIARLISGNITESSLRHANEMLESGENFYKNLK
ncbi:MAG: DNA repair protein RecN [Clostridia bacterium]|nr:DNA repair protein RecN [Clostridia bacterium]